jgi:type IV secretory pathway TrbF-like protein
VQPENPAPAKSFNEAKRLYVEQYGSALVMVTYLKIALLAISLVAVLLVCLNAKTYNTFRNFKPLVIRINEVGKAEAVTYDSLTYQPRESELKYFLMRFITDYYGRSRVTVRDAYARSLYFLDGRLADALITANRKSHMIENFFMNGDDEVEVSVKSVSLEDLRTQPYRASAEYQKIYYSRSDHTETRRERYIGNFVFTVREHVPNSFIPVNPLGLTITYFREDQAFQ